MKMENIAKLTGFLVNGEGIHYLLNNKCDCCKDHNKYLNVTPFNEANISSVSLDICIGDYLIEFKDKMVTYFDSAKYTITEFLDKYTCKYDIERDLGNDIIIHKDQFFLLEIKELIQFNRHVTGHLLGKSSIGRLGLIIQTASIINPMFGYGENPQRLILEIKNISPITLKFKKGDTIAQVQFYYFPKAISKHYQTYGMFK